jgi:molybdenum cofactor cytidylyltransferase
MTSPRSALCGIILAAGKGTRVCGRIKALLETGGQTFVEKIINKFSCCGVENIMLVLGYRSGEVIQFLSARKMLNKVIVAVNDDPDSDQTASLRAAIKHLPAECSSIVFTPVDHPLTKQTTYEQLISEWEKEPGNIYIPSCNYRKGHPTIFPQQVYEDIMTESLSGGARELLKKYQEKIRYVVVDDPAIVYDFDTLQELEQYNKSGIVPSPKKSK